MTKITPEMNETAIRTISAMGITDPQDAWSYVRKQFRVFDFRLILADVEAGAEAGIGCLRTMAGHYQDHLKRNASR